MRGGHVTTIFLKELRETLRDRRTLLMMVGLPVIIYPLMLMGLSRLQESRAEEGERSPSVVAVWGGVPHGAADTEAGALLDFKPWLGITAEVRDGLERGTLAPPPLDVERGDEKDATRDGGRQGGQEREAENPVLAAARMLVTARRADAVLVVWPGADARLERGEALGISVYYDSVREESRRARRRLVDHLESWRDKAVAQRESARGLPDGFGRLLDLTARDVAPAARQAGYVLGNFLPFLLVSLSLFGGFYPAVDMTAGEKERGTMQTLLCAPVTSAEIVSGKFLAVWLISAVTATVNLVSLAFTVGRVMPGGAGQMEPLAFVLTALMLVPVTLTTAAVFLAVAVLAKDFKDGQNFLTPAYLLLVMPASVTMLPGIELNAWTAFVPIVNIALLTKSLLVGEAHGDLVFLTLVSSLAYASLAITFATRVFQREQVLLGGKEPWRALVGLEPRPGQTPTPAMAFTLFAVALVSAFYGSLWLVDRSVPVALATTQVAFFLLPAVALTAALRLSPSGTFLLARPRVLALAGAALVGATAWLAIGGIATRLFPPPDSLVRALERVLMLGDEPLPLWTTWLFVALLPAVCEELLFRGFIMRGLRRLGMWPAIVISALLFGLAHASIYRLLPTFALGIVLGYAAWRTGSIVTSMAVHALNNGLVATLAREPQWAERLGLGSTEVSWQATLLGVAGLAAGVALVRAGGRNDGASDQRTAPARIEPDASGTRQRPG
ncbi:MAG: ABC transporter permease subunit [Vicinamibacteraceae bacterium]|nr:ABC transporter permease subunit [Vicinamibacteraceae bacterium]